MYAVSGCRYVVSPERRRTRAVVNDRTPHRLSMFAMSHVVAGFPFLTASATAFALSHSGPLLGNVASWSLVMKVMVPREPPPCDGSVNELLGADSALHPIRLCAATVKV